jgi:hypothetical protein
MTLVATDLFSEMLGKAGEGFDIKGVKMGTLLEARPVAISQRKNSLRAPLGIQRDLKTILGPPHMVNRMLCGLIRERVR